MAVPFAKLLHISLFESLPEEALRRIAAQVVERSFARREMILAKEQKRHVLGFLIEGRLQGIDFSVDGRGAGLYFVEPGDFFGELSVMDGKAPAEYVIAAARSTVGFLDAETARRWILGNPLLAQRIMLKLAARVREVTAQRTLLSLPNPMQRLCVQLMQLAQRTPDAPGSLPAINPVPTHQELAVMINASRETVTRAFQVLAVHEAIRRNGSTLLIMRPDLLHGVGLGETDLSK